MTHIEALRAVIDSMASDGGASQEQVNTILLTSIASSLADIADSLAEKKGEAEIKA